MRIKIDINPNCSEAILRLRTDNLISEQVMDIFKLLEQLKQDTKWYDTTFKEEVIFGIPSIVIKGEVPFNEYIWLADSLRSLPFGYKLHWERRIE